MIKCNFLGRLGADAELVDGKNSQFYSFRVATDDYDFKTKENVTTWVNVRIGKERVGNMKLSKGSHVFITGTLKASTYQTKNGDAAVSIDITGDSINFVRGGGSGNTETTTSTTTDSTVTTGTFKQTVVAETTVAKEPEDDLPF